MTPWEEEAERAAGRGERVRALGVAMPGRLGRFRVRGVLGSGSQATVYRAFDPDLEREVALKVPSPGSYQGETALVRFEREAKALARLKHPGIVPVFEWGRLGDVPYLATARIEGRTLAGLLGDGPMEITRAVGVAADLADALGYAHGLGVVHRDVKPANVLVEAGSGSVYLTDFGLAPRPGSAEGGRSGLIVGTPAYVAPERAACEGELARAEGDQYSLGVVLYEMLCGRPPFLGPPALVLDSARFDDPVPPRLLRPAVPRSLEAICRKAMARRPADRYPDCRSFAVALRVWLARSAAARRARLTRRLRRRSIGRAAAWLRRRPAAALSAALAVLGLAASAVLATALVAPLAPTPAPAAPARGNVPGALLSDHAAPGRG